MSNDNGDLIKLIHDNVHWLYYTAALIGVLITFFKFICHVFEKTKLHRIICLITDVPETISDIKKVQNLLYSELLLQGKIVTTILDSLELAQFLCGPDGKCIKVNSKWISITGLSEYEALGHNWLLSIHPDDRDKIEHKWNSMISKNIPFEETFRYEHRVTKAITTVKCKATDVMGEDNQRIYIIGISKIV